MLPSLIIVNSYIQAFFHTNLDEMEAKKTLLFKARWLLSRGTEDEFHRMDDSHRKRALILVDSIILELKTNPIPLPTPIFGVGRPSLEDIYIGLLPKFEELHMQIEGPDSKIKTSEFIDELTMIEKEIKKAIATLHSQNAPVRTFPRPHAAAIVPILDLTLFDPGNAPIIGRKISWNEAVEVHHIKKVVEHNAYSIKRKYCCL